MRFLKSLKLKTIILSAVCVLLVIGSALCFFSYRRLASTLESQKMAERWTGESGDSFAQISCFIPTGSEIQVPDVYTFRYAMIKALTSASLDPNASALWDDAWSCTGKLGVSSAIDRGEASVIAVGGDYFSFHPIKLLNGSYIMPDDLMQDRAVLDNELAWLLFGSTDIQGLSFNIGERSFTVAGVIEREKDKASSLAYQSGMGLYMSYDTYLSMVETAGISCYEFVMREPVEGYARSTAETSFPVKASEIVDNTGRFDPIPLLRIALKPYTRVMQSSGVIYPYWENAARYTESLAASRLLWSIILIIAPAVMGIILAVKYLSLGKQRLEEDYIPAVKDKVEEGIRVRQRKRWERYHGKH